MRIFLLLIFTFLSAEKNSILLSQEEEPFYKEKVEEPKVQESEFARKKKKWQGEIVSLYYEKNECKIRISFQQVKRKKIQSEIIQNILEQKKFPIYQKYSNREIGDLEVTSVREEDAGNRPSKEFREYFITGNFTFRDPYWKKNITQGSYIAFFENYKPYIEPVRFYQQKSTPVIRTIIHPKDRKEMVLVDGGVFIHGQGYDALSDNYNPNYFSPKISKIKDIPGFFIDKYETTNEEYLKFIYETNHPYPKHWIGKKIPEGKESHPVVGLTYYDVEAYAKWAGKKIPNEFQWEKAARGPGVEITPQKDDSNLFNIFVRKYPFGDDYDSEYCNSRESGIGSTISVLEYIPSSASPYGALGMCGNAPEWTSSFYEPYPETSPSNPSQGKNFKVIRGGGYEDHYKDCTVYARKYGGLPNLKEDRRAGFRLIIDADR
jgi:formylglycine-generating enzyme required for sulfatase activity